MSNLNGKPLHNQFVCFDTKECLFCYAFKAAYERGNKRNTLWEITATQTQNNYEKIVDCIHQVIEQNSTKATQVNKKESLRYLYAVEMAQYILKARDGEQKDALRAIDKAQMALENEAAIQRVRELHVPRSASDGSLVCIACESFYEDSGPVDYPCPTIQALDGDDE